MKRQWIIGLVTAVAGSMVTAQEIHPIWVQHHNGLVNVDPANKLPVLLRRASTTGDEAYLPLITGAATDFGRLTIKGFVNFVRYDDDHYLLGIRENGIDEVTETNRTC